MDLITKDSDTTLVLFSSLDRVLENVEYVVTNYRPVLNGEHYLTGDEGSIRNEILKTWNLVLLLS